MRFPFIAVLYVLIMATLLVAMRFIASDVGSNGQLLVVSRSSDIAPARQAVSGQPVNSGLRFRMEPFFPKPHGHFAAQLTEQQVADVLCAAVPSWNPPVVPSLLHELMLWGPESQLPDEILGYRHSGVYAERILLNDDLCRELTLKNEGEYIVDTPYGMRPVILGHEDAVANRGEAHYGQLLKILGEAGVPRSSITSSSSGRTGTAANILTDAALRYSLSKEQEFIACAMAYWLPKGTKEWENEFRETISFNGIISRLVGTPYGQGACGGCHVPYAVTIILRLDADSPVLSQQVRLAAIRWLQALGDDLAKCQLPSGGWDRTWADVTASRMWGDDLLDRIGITGHHLEWISLAPVDALPSDTVVKNAVDALHRDVYRLTKHRTRSFKTLLPSAHAARALCLLRCATPSDVFLRAWDEGTVTVQSTD